MLLWKPSAAQMNKSHLTHFMRWISHKLQRHNVTYDDLYDFSICEPELFWSYIWDYFNIVGYKGPAPYMDYSDVMYKTLFFPKAKLNYAENILTTKRADAIAIIEKNEKNERVTLTFGELREHVESIACFFDRQGITKRARICAVLPNISEAVTSFLACAAQGNIFSSSSPDFGFQALKNRFSQIKPEILICCEAYSYNGKLFDIRQRMVDLLQALPTVKKVIVVTSLDQSMAHDLHQQMAAIKPSHLYQDIVSDYHKEPYVYKKHPFNTPLYILFSSGTTGVPKCIVHGQGGIMLKHLVEHALHTNLDETDCLFYFTTTGWMMWNWLVGALVNATQIVLYDGSPTHNGPNTLFDIIDAENVSVFGTSAKYIDYLRKSQAKPINTHELYNLKTILSTGSVLSNQGFRYVYENIKKDVLLSSISGGTDICGCFVAGNPLRPVYSGEIQGAVLGMSTKVFDPQGQVIENKKGELICDKAFPTMPLYFWGDKDDTHYHKAYFSYFENVWCQGDYALQTQQGGFIIYGRSDATLNPGGVRIGTAEIYAVVENLTYVKEAVAVGQEWQDDTRVVLFVVMQEGYQLDIYYQNQIKQHIKELASPRHVPSLIICVDDIPRTRSGKISETVVRDAIHNRTINNLDAIANPEIVKQFQNMDALKN